MTIKWCYGLPRPGLWAYGDGPLRPEHWADKCIGRVTGISQPLQTASYACGSTYMRAISWPH